jgi:hypothetical protein
VSLEVLGNVEGWGLRIWKGRNCGRRKEVDITDGIEPDTVGEKVGPRGRIGNFVM